MRFELSRRRRRPRKRRAAHPREWAVRSFPATGAASERAGDVWGPVTYQGALVHAFIELLQGKQFEFGPYEILVARVPHRFAVEDLVILPDGSPARITRIRDYEVAAAYYVQRMGVACGSGSCGDIWWLETSLRPAGDGAAQPTGVRP
jgi:hypothetical protein